MSKTNVRKAHATFQTQGRLLQELGERLVARTDVALMELIKNSYDADATKCWIKYSDDRIEIHDNGHGMTDEEFIAKWMNIATPDKQRSRVSRKFKRTVTGSKGIGRFAVRFLGRHLRLETVANIPGEKQRSLLTIDFDWESIDKSTQLHTVRIPYTVRAAPTDRDTGTCLVISQLRASSSVVINREMRTELLSLVNPYSGLESGKFERKGQAKADPGFDLNLPELGGEGITDLATTVVQHYYAQLQIRHEEGTTLFTIKQRDGRRLLQRKIASKQSQIGNGFFADIRYFPRRSGMFRGTDVDGRSVWTWIREHGGVGVVDHGFRIRPYGFQDDDWLSISADTATNRRQWRTSIMNRLFEIPASSKARENPMLYLPSAHQLIGAVFVESSQQADSKRPTDLTPSMDREGFVDNEGFRELTELVRTGLEMLAFADHREQRRLSDEKRRRETKLLRSDLRKAADYIQTVPGLTDDDRDRVVAQFTKLSTELADVEEYHQLSATKLDLMGLLGAIAGFVTHEMQRMLSDLGSLVEHLRKKLKSDPSATELVDRVAKSYESIAAQLDFSTAFIGMIQDRTADWMEANSFGAISSVVSKFDNFTAERKIDVQIIAEDDVKSPTLPPALYVGVIMNLFTNAMKATMGGERASADAKVSIRAWNEPKHHIVEVADNGAGIPPELRSRIWDPLFTTTSSEQYNPLGSGMGLGLTLVKKVIEDVKGSIALLDEAPPGFSTCFRVRFPRNK